MSSITPEQTLDAVARVLGGDKEAFAAIVRGYHHRVRSLLAGYCRSSEEVEEFAHIAFVECYVRLEEYDPARGPFAWWLVTIARSRALDELRRRKAEGRRQLRYLELAAARRCEPQRIEQQHVALDDCLSQLSEDDAQLVRARYDESRTSVSIGSSLGKSAVAVRRSLQRVRERLRRCMEHRIGGGVEGVEGVA